MKVFVRQIFKFTTLGIGAVLTVILLIPTGALLMLLSVIWKVMDRMIRLLEGQDQGHEHIDSQ